MLGYIVWHCTLSTGVSTVMEFCWQVEVRCYLSMPFSAGLAEDSGFISAKYMAKFAPTTGEIRCAVVALDLQGSGQDVHGFGRRCWTGCT